MEEIRYKKFKGWNGTVYWMRMSKEEIESRRKIGLMVAIITMVPLTILVFAFAAGLFG